MVILEPPSRTLALLRSALPESHPGSCNGDFNAKIGTNADSSECEEILAYVATMAATLAEAQDFDASNWMDVLSPYLSTIPSFEDETISKDTVEKFRALTEADVLRDDSDDEEEDETGEQICNIKFSLAYGGKILLHQTRLKLRRGHRYALVGQNGAGKTTLMTAINKGKLEGWPMNLRTEYVDSGSNVDIVHEAKNVMNHLITSTGKSKEACVEMLKMLKFTDVMMNGTIGELSGGWQMKLRLSKAVLVDADILLLDEPTNHLGANLHVYIIFHFCENLIYLIMTTHNHNLFPSYFHCNK